jgi:hypothetical protein
MSTNFGGLAPKPPKIRLCRSTYYNEKYLYLLTRSNLLTPVLKIAEGKNFGKYQIVMLEWLNFKDHLGHVFNFWAKQHGIVSFAQCQIPWMPISNFMMPAQLHIQIYSAFAAW